jgi:hypothetical protein
MSNRWQNSLLLIVIGGFFALSCNKEGGKCFTNTGSIMTQERVVADFDSIALYDNVDLILTQDTANRVNVEAGQNIIAGISTTVTNHMLVIHNLNNCNWLRSYESPIRVHVCVKNLMKVHYESAGNITSTNTIHANNLHIDLWGGCGVVDLDVNINIGTFIQHMGTADMVLRGQCNVSSVYAGDYGKLQLSGMATGYTFVKNAGSNDCFVSVSKVLDATIGSIGNIYYSGNPDSVYTHISGSGAVIPY